MDEKLVAIIAICLLGISAIIVSQDGGIIATAIAAIAGIVGYSLGKSA